ncbi:HlyD family secretion protein [Photobacterium sp. SDRW27]|uniref:HlyD family secretion protein n=1 Tax=Photobacterium obscurum TaxID=2829490 RepID=UPI00224417DC|nr:HlyD family secretion protein [Photobacterium obscurum]MCW8328888.1 HlyD family secretion protein [Photobacterium obscurum]
MTENTQKQETKELGQKKGNKVKTTTNTLLALTALSILTCIFADRIVPTTDNVRVEGNVISLIPQVSGQVSSIQVQANSEVKKGDALVQITPIDYQIAVKKAETKLEMAGQQVGAQMAGVLSAQAQLTNALVSQENAKRQGQRVLAMAEKGVVSKSDADKTRAALDKADADVLNAKANLEKAQTQVGAAGEDNAQIQAALLELQQAQLNLERTMLRAPSDGAVTNFNLSEGAYASAGSPLMTFVEKNGFWIEAFFRENSMGHIKPGDKVEVALDYAPGETFEGTISSVDLGVAWGTNNQPGTLASVKNQNGWLRDTQRMPVSIKLENEEAMQMMRIGGQADVIVYTGDNTLFNLLGKAWINLVSWFSYVR